MKDRISLENGAILTNSNRWPLLIDPQLQGIRWLIQHETIHCEKQGKSLVMLKNGEKTMMMKLIQAISNGDTVILENIDEHIDAALTPILSKSTHRKGKNYYLKLGDEDIEYSPNFQLFLQTKLSNPHYQPEILTLCNLINFLVTKKGLEDHLLAMIVSEEEPELEKTRNELILSFNNYKIQLKELEDLLLERLSNAPEDILSDIPLIEGLEHTKQTATEINEAVTKAIQTEIGINAAREIYRIIATEAALLYFILLQLQMIDHMYQYSLDSFVMFFLKALRMIPVAIVMKNERVQALQSILRMTIFKFVNRGLFAKHKIIFLTQLTLTLIQQHLITDECGYSYEALRFLLLGAGSIVSGGPGGKIEEKSSISWMSDSVYNTVKALTNLDGYDKLLSDMEENSVRFYDTPETEKLPGAWREFDRFYFKKLLIIKALRPDRILSAILTFIKEILPSGKDYL